MSRVILHSDLNGYYASVECLYHPEIRDKPVVVGGDPEKRHGIIQAKNEVAKKYGIATGEAIWQAQEKCPNVIVRPADFSLYLHYSRLVRDIYAEYTDQVEPFGIDEGWLDVTGSTGIHGSGVHIAEELRQRIRKEVGLTVSIGVSWNKIFAKLGSDYKKPDAVTVFSQDNYKELVFPLSVEDLLYVGRATKRKLHARGIRTIGQLAGTDADILHSFFGKMGYVLHSFANGYDAAPVARIGETAPIKSVGNSITAPRDLTCKQDVKMVLYMLTESVAHRMREQGLAGDTVAIHVRDKSLFSFERQTKLKAITCATNDIAAQAMALFLGCYRFGAPIRSLGVRVTGLVPADRPHQMDLFGDAEQQIKREQLDHVVDGLRRRYGNLIVQRGVMLGDTERTSADLKASHVIHPVGYLLNHFTHLIEYLIMLIITHSCK